MTSTYLAFAFFLLLNLLAGLVRVARGPTRADRLVAAQLFGTTGVAFLLAMAHAVEAPSLRDVALVFAVLAPVNAIVFSRSLRAATAGGARAGEAAADAGGDG